jgi:hypothetical protein
MAIYLKTTNPHKLLVEFKKAIDDQRVTTWSYDVDGDFTHTPDQWKNKSWLRPKEEAEHLALYIIGPKNTNISTEVYAIYHGRFIESMLVHCDKLFTSANATALPVTGRDRVQN